MTNRIYIYLLVFLVFGAEVYAENNIPDSESYKTYLEYEELITQFQQIAGMGQQLKFAELTNSAGNKPVMLFSAVSKPDNPAIFVSANLQGNLPVTSSGALYLAVYLALNPEYYEDYSWYILPCGNPDAYISNLNNTTGAFNATPVNADLDELTDEDGKEDLNKDGVFSLMRVKDLLGDFMINEKHPRLMMNAKLETPSSKRYSLYSEGIDNDGDGLYNEDAPGGVNIAKTFPYNFENYVPENGRWPGSENETRAALAFFSAHPEICLTINMGTSDYLRQDFIPTKKDTKPVTYIIPKNHASIFGVNAKKKYTLQQLIKIYKTNRPTHNVDELYVLSQLPKKPLQAPFQQDKDSYSALSASFKKYTKNDSSLNFVPAVNNGNGSLELWSYYHLGLPSIAMRLWDIPDLRADSIKSAKKKENFSREQAFLLYNDSILNGKGFAEWISISHPDFVNAEVGGINTNYIFNPLNEYIYSALKSQVTWIPEIGKLLPKVRVDSIAHSEIGESTYRIEVFVHNNGEISAPLFIGAYNRRPSPIVITLTGDAQIISGKQRTVIKRIEAQKTVKLEYIVSTKSDKIQFEFDAPNVKTQAQTLKLK